MIDSQPMPPPTAVTISNKFCYDEPEKQIKEIIQEEIIQVFFGSSGVAYVLSEIAELFGAFSTCTCRCWAQKHQLRLFIESYGSGSSKR